MAASIKDQIEAIDKQIAAREEEFEASIKELRDQRHALVSERKRELQSELRELESLDGTTRRRRSSGTRAPQASPEEREAQVLDLVKSGITRNTDLASTMGVSVATVSKSVNKLLEDGKLRAEGERRNRMLIPA